MQILDVVDSTQTEAKRQIDVFGIIESDEILAKVQTAGITSKENVEWQSQSGDLTMSFIRLNHFSEENVIYYKFCSGIAVRDTLIYFLEKYNKKDLIKLLKIKWPNDILIGDKKVCGVLARNYKKHVIIGVGLNLIKKNILTLHFPATSFEEEVGVVIEPEVFAEALKINIDKQIQILKQYGFGAIKDNWKQSAYMLGQELVLMDHGIVVFEDIDDQGHIVARKEDGRKHIIISSDTVIGGLKK